MNHNARWFFLLGDTLAVGASAINPERARLELLMLGLSLVMTLAPVASQVTTLWAKRLLRDDGT